MTPLKIPLQVVCPNCQLGNLPGSPYCSGCGAPLGGALTSPGQTSVAKSGPITESQLNRFSTGDLLSMDILLLRKLSADGQDPVLVKQAFERASQIMVGGEEIKYIAAASKTMVGATPDCVVGTSKRVIVYKKKLLGKVEQDDCYWRDLSDAQMKDGRNGVTLSLSTIQGWRLNVDGLPKSQARAVYELAIDNCERLQEKMRQEALAANPELVAQPAPQAQAQPPIIQRPVQAAGPHPVYEQSPIVRSPSGPLPAYAPAASQAPVSGPLGRIASGPLRGQASGPLPSQPPMQTQSGPLPVQAQGQPAAATDSAQPSLESVLGNVLRASHPHEMPTQQPVTQAAAFQAPPQLDVQPFVFEEQTSPPLPLMSANSAPISEPLPPAMSQPQLAPSHSNNGVHSNGSSPVDTSHTPQAPQAYQAGPAPAPSLSEATPSEPLAVPVPMPTHEEDVDTGLLHTRLLQYSPEAEAGVTNGSYYGYGASGPLTGSMPTTPIVPGMVQPKSSKPRASTGSTRSSASKAVSDDPVLKMRQLKEMLDNALITQEDYESKKAEILGRI